ncbi:hypothetical protein RRG08_023900 [Elysia crispata]|uniref:Uncharacterized protein n=1 Tax=Elysia crispata TaxID=231223 RepID=A0AAE1ACZ7_9GAST|nr:hypothetical protein RRG08_023900 [Elysia crispata]
MRKPCERNLSEPRGKILRNLNGGILRKPCGRTLKRVAKDTPWENIDEISWEDPKETPWEDAIWTNNSSLINLDTKHYYEMELKPSVTRSLMGASLIRSSIKIDKDLNRARNLPDY